MIFDRKDFEVGEERRRQVDGSRMTTKLGIDRAEIEWRKSFTNFTETDEQALSEISETIERAASELPDDLESHVYDHEEALVYLDRSTKGFDQLKQAHREYLTDLGSRSHGQAYFDQRARIGRIHDMLGLGPKVYLGAYSVYFGGLVEAIGEQVKKQAATGSMHIDDAIDQTIEYVMALFKLINLDQQVVMDTYIHSANQELERELEQQRSVAETVRHSVGESQQMASEITANSDEIGDLAQTQVESVNEVSEEVSDMSATVEEIASTAQEVAATSTRAEDLADDGRDAATEAIEVMEQIDQSTGIVEDDVDRLNDRIDEVDEIIEVINEIADQTNLLALNASIEAARAGEAGDGFAVVADEVKNLAEESQAHASEIEEMVEEIKDDTAETVASLERTTEQVGDGIEQVESAMETLREIADAVGETTRGIREVSDATDSQAASTEEVASMVDELVGQAEQITERIEEISSANDRQAERIGRIEETVGELVK